jgi:hypothetical protein
LKACSRALIAAAFALTANASQASTFNIVVNFGGGFSTSQQSIFSQAEVYWESLITGYQAGISIPQLVLGTAVVVEDGLFGGLAYAGPTAGTLQSGYVLPTAGMMFFDTADLEWLESGGLLLDVIKHEMAHAMGFGTLWTHNGVYVDGSGQYTGANALAAYRAEFDAGAAFVPVDGSDGHWSESWAGGPLELMTPYLQNTNFISNTTIQSFVDIGYSTTPVPLPAGAVLLTGGLGVLGAVGARRRRAK